MKVKTITYQRVLNLGNYENRKLELSAELDDGEDVNQAVSDLKEITESHIQKELLTKIEEEIKSQQKVIKELTTDKLDLREEVRELKTQIEEYKKKLSTPNDLDDELGDNVPF